MNDSRHQPARAMICLLGAVFLLAPVLTPHCGASDEGAIASGMEANDLMQFLDGSSLHGKLGAIDTTHGLQWLHPDVKKPIEFKPGNVAWIRFQQARQITSHVQPTSRLRFHNGDEVFGSLNWMNSDEVELQTWFGSSLRAPRSSLKSVAFLSKGYAILYEGPTSLEGWVHGRNQELWRYRDGALTAGRAATIGRDLRLSGSSSIGFDLAWNGQFSLIVALYTSVLDRFDYSSSCYMFYLSQGYVTLQRVQGGAGVVNLGQAQIPDMAKRNSLRIDIRANKEDSTIGLLVNDRLVQRWKDPAGFVGRGSGVVFFAQLEGPSISISNIKAAQWEGETILEDPANSLEGDLVHLANRDKVGGKLLQVGDGKLSIDTGHTTLDIPLSRVTQINLATPKLDPHQPDPWQIRAYFAGGGTITLDLERWNEQQVHGKSRNFGQISFSPEAVRQLRFNLLRSRGSTDEKNDAADLWDFD
jgi:hypothetical protein